MKRSKKQNKQIIRAAGAQLNITCSDFVQLVLAICARLEIPCTLQNAHHHRQRIANAILLHFPDLAPKQQQPARNVVKANFGPKRPTEKELKAFYGGWEWSRLRYDFLKGRERRCQCCGASPDDGFTKIVVDHIKPIRHHWALRLDSKNLQILCDPCNMGKGSRDESDWAKISGRVLWS